MQLEVYRAAGTTLELLGTCELNRLSGRFLEVLHQAADDGAAHGSLQPPEAHAFHVIDLRDERGQRSGLLVDGPADPGVLPGWTPVPPGRLPQSPVPIGEGMGSGGAAAARRGVAPSVDANSRASRTTSPSLV
ncbi:hypothetical protein GXW71_19205 [Roseomonas hellenica]|uniref:Uncharacterized protein n=1 Tax=Plastoroseomonas hellenica TaxID=2687306 RepID=A0ABS5F2Y6_9PROT|nr:hypothetical protein [Plastoroseomonas hellenica]MBR0666495.1 hypothetical protein [Plastoroseomonas hellenica]